MLLNVKFMKEYFDSSEYDRQPIYLFLAYLIFIVSFAGGFILGFKYHIPYIFGFLTGMASDSENKGIITLLLPCLMQVFLIFGVIAELLYKLMLEPICKCKFKNKK